MPASCQAKGRATNPRNVAHRFSLPKTPRSMPSATGIPPSFPLRSSIASSHETSHQQSAGCRFNGRMHARRAPSRRNCSASRRRARRVLAVWDGELRALEFDTGSADLRGGQRGERSHPVARRERRCAAAHVERRDARRARSVARQIARGRQVFPYRHRPQCRRRRVRMAGVGLGAERRQPIYRSLGIARSSTLVQTAPCSRRARGSRDDVCAGGDLGQFDRRVRRVLDVVDVRARHVLHHRSKRSETPHAAHPESDAVFDDTRLRHLHAREDHERPRRTRDTRRGDHPR